MKMGITCNIKIYLYMPRNLQLNFKILSMHYYYFFFLLKSGEEIFLHQNHMRVNENEWKDE